MASSSSLPPVSSSPPLPQQQQQAAQQQQQVQVQQQQQQQQQQIFVVSLQAIFSNEAEKANFEKCLSLLCHGSASLNTLGSRSFLRHEKVFINNSSSSAGPVDSKRPESELRLFSEVTESKKLVPVTFSSSSSSSSSSTSTESTESATPIVYEEMPVLEYGTWYVRMLGRPVLPQKHECLVRSVEDIMIQADHTDFLSFLGFQFSYEFAQRGTLYHTDNLFIKVYQTFKVRTTHDLRSMIPSGNRRWMVEMYSPCSESDIIHCERMLLTYAQMLQPFACFVKVNPQHV